MNVFNKFLEKHNVIISFILGIIGVIIGLISDSEYVAVIRGLIVLLFVVILWLIVAIRKAKESLIASQKTVLRLNNTLEKVNLEFLNRFRSSPLSNTKLDIEELKQHITVTGNDAELSFEYKGRCIHEDGEDSLYTEVYVLNIFVPIGFVIDAITGAMMKYSPTTYDVTLDKK